VPFLLETQHVSAWENNIEVIVILNVSKMRISRQDTHVKLFSSSSSKDYVSNKQFCDNNFHPVM
jgi:hypothetical protein